MLLPPYCSPKQSLKGRRSPMARIREHSFSASSSHPDFSCCWKNLSNRVRPGNKHLAKGEHRQVGLPKERNRRFLHVSLSLIVHSVPVHTPHIAHKTHVLILDQRYKIYKDVRDNYFHLDPIPIFPLVTGSDCNSFLVSPSRSDPSLYQIVGISMDGVRVFCKAAS